MRLSDSGVKALQLATRIALDSGHLKTDEHASVLELYHRATTTLENWKYDRDTETWSHK